MYGYIYETYNKVNGKRYIGQHKNSSFEVDSSYVGSGIILEKAILKYGLDSFEVKLLDKANTKDELDRLEKYYIRVYRDKYGIENIYNIADGGQGGACYPMTEERRQKIGAALRGRKRDPEVVKRVANKVKGRKHSEESKLKSRNSNLDQKRSIEAKQNMSKNHANVVKENNPFYGQKHSTESKLKIGKAAIGRNSGKRWVNNGKINKIVYLENFDLGIEWKIGRIKNSL